MLTVGTGGNADACRMSCNDIERCVFYQWDSYDGGSCKHYLSAPITNGMPLVQVGFKVDTGIYSVVNGDDSSVNIGKVIDAPVKSSVRECTQECDKVEGCVVLVISKNPELGFAGPSNTGYTCHLRSGELSADIRTRYQVKGNYIGAWFNEDLI
jgi:hypothetical protein